LEIVEEATGMTDLAVIIYFKLSNQIFMLFNLSIVNQISEKRKKLKKEGKDTRIDEDDPVKYELFFSFLLWVLAYPLTLLSISRYRRAVYVMTIKLFADMERKRRELEQRDMEERKRKRETEIEAEEKAKVDKEWQKNFEESRQGRVSSWQKFQHKKTKTSKGFFKPPKNKMEQR
jgi:DnaJ family protein C protein 8